MGVFTEFGLMVRMLMNGQYPNFVTNGNTVSEIPVFSFHSVGAQEFESQLLYLDRNNYQTLFADDLTGEKMNKRREFRVQS